MTPARRNAIVDEWLHAVATPATARFLRRPLAVIVDRVLDEDLPGAAASVEEIVRLHAVNHMSSSQAVSFLLQLRDILRDQALVGIVPDTSDTIDRLVLVALDSYVSSRERLGEIKRNERARRTWLLDRLCARENDSTYRGPGTPPGRAS